MYKFSETLFKQLEDQLKFISIEQKNILKRAELSIGVCEKAVSQLRGYVAKKTFKDADEEIQFFKRIKPRFTSKLNYFILVFNLEKGRPLTSIKAQIVHCEKAQAALDEYLEKNIEFYTYYRTEATTMDEKYFLRDNVDIHPASDEYMFDFDRSFNTTHDRKVSKILANDMFALYIRNELQRLELVKHPDIDKPENPLLWTESKVSLIELIYAFHVSGSFNRGTLELKELAEAISQCFNIELGDIYRTWAEIKLRKEPTKYLDALKMFLENKIKEDLK